MFKAGEVWGDHWMAEGIMDECRDTAINVNQTSIQRDVCTAICETSWCNNSPLTRLSGLIVSVLLLLFFL